MQPPNRPSPQKFIKHAADVATFYGFKPAGEMARLVRQATPQGERIRAARPGAHNFLTVSASCVSWSLHKQEPALAWWATPSPSHLPVQGQWDEAGEFGLSLSGSSHSVGEVVLLKALAAVVVEWGTSLRTVRLNTLCDRDSKARYARELTFYFRKHLTELCPDCRAAVGSDPTRPFSCAQEQCRAIATGAPRAMNYLSEKSRAHFRDVLEHLEGLGLPYELDDLLVADERESQLLFAFDIDGEDATVMGAMGGRFDDHLRRHTGRKDATGLSASVFFRKKGLTQQSFVAPAVKAPRVFFVQLGLRAKMAGLSVIDNLRAAQVPVMQSFEAAKLEPQLRAARDAGVSYLIIMGQREALDGTVIVREIDNSSQTVVELPNLPRFLKTLK